MENVNNEIDKEMKNLLVCPKCGVSFVEGGIQEVLVGAVVKTDVSFRNDEVSFVNNAVSDFDEQWIVCLLCDEELHDRTAIEVIEAHKYVKLLKEICGDVNTD